MKLILAPLAALAALALAAPALADPTPSELTAASAAELRGAEIYAYDQAAWHSTDRLQEDMRRGRVSVEDMTNNLSGFIVEPVSDGLLLATYYSKNGGKTFALARYWMAGSKVKRGGLVKPGEDAALSPLALKLIERREQAAAAATADDVSICTNGAPNTVVLPPRPDGSIPVYFMSASVENGTFPAGGHYLYLFDAAGKLASKRPFTKSCVMVDWRNLPKGAAGASVSHILDPQPTEIHVFVSLNMPGKLFVITTSNKDLWLIDHGQITFKQVMEEAP